MTKTLFEDIFIPYEPIDTLQYGAWGEARDGNTTANVTPFGFTGRWGGYTDARLGKVLNWNRWYGPEAGRWGSRDPIGIKGGLNIYAYSFSNPILFIDPSGLKVQKCCQDVHTGNAFMDSVASGMGIKHCFLRTNSAEGGMEPAVAGPLPSWPFGIDTLIGPPSNSTNRTCTDINDVDENCVNAYLGPCTSTGKWGLSNNCQTLASDILNKCSTKNCGSGPTPRRSKDL